MSETTNLKLFKHDNPSTNTNEFNVDTALNQNWDKIDSFVGTVNSKILEIQNKNTEQDEKISSMQSEIELIQEKDNVQDTKLAELQAENERLRKDINGLPSGQATAETIYLTDSAEMRFKKFGIGGNSVQETSVQGKNYFTGNKIGSGVKAGIEYCFENSIIKLNGISTETSEIFTKSTKVILPAGNYNFNLTVKAGNFTRNSKDLAIYLMNSEGYLTGNYSSSGIALGNLESNNNDNRRFTLAEDTELYIRIFVNGSGLKCNNLEIYAQIESGSSYTGFEQFIPNMPSTYYPSEVKSCGDNINYFDEELELGSIDNTTGENAENNSTIRSKNHIAVLSNQELTISNDKQYSNYIYEYDKDKNFIKYTANNQNPYTFITSSTTKYIKFRTIASSKQNDLTTKFKLEKGSKATPYSPYGQGCINEVICNKNIFNLNKWFDNAVASSCTKTLLENGVKIDFIEGTDAFVGHIGSAGSVLAESVRKCLTKAKPSTKYTISLSSIKKCYIGYYDKNYISLGYVAINTATMKFTTPTNTKYISLRLGIQDSNYTTYSFTDIQIEEGTTATDYIPHKEQTYTIPTQQPFRAIGDIKDTFIKKNNKRYERHYIERLILNGTENWRYDTNNNRFYFEKTGQKGYGYSVICSHYLKGDTTKNNNTCETWSSAILFRNEQFTTVNDFKTHLQEQYNAGTPVYIDYVLVEPIDIECTPEQNEILDKIEQEAHTYKNVTHIYSTDEVEPVVDVEYLKDIETLINKATTVVE